MARSTEITKPVTRKVTDERGQPLLVTLTREGILLRRPRCRDSYLLPFTAAETRALALAHDGIGIARRKKRA